MATLVQRSLSEPIRASQDWNATWNGPDHGLIKCWETGRTLATQASELSARCKAEELPPMHWKGGVSRALKNKDKFGALRYLAQWQGLRGEDLNIDLEAEVTLTCSATGMTVTFTPDLTKLADQLPL
ncbi:hypothetical protein [Pseudomonas aeruginosa]|uniref:hypothetical protein n=1 Tax=Pseudomonas aeruginosa TaxID=287 RepID=UPI001CD7C0CE|nr:hypothetical protein [Pseudomonas aeruginosa]